MKSVMDGAVGRWFLTKIAKNRPDPSAAYKGTTLLTQHYALI
jgi:hypothetical protein